MPRTAAVRASREKAQMQNLDEQDARQGERQKLFKHVLLPSFILAATALLVILIVYVF